MSTLKPSFLSFEIIPQKAYAALPVQRPSCSICLVMSAHGIVDGVCPPQHAPSIGFSSATNASPAESNLLPKRNCHDKLPCSAGRLISRTSVASSMIRFRLLAKSSISLKPSILWMRVTSILLYSEVRSDFTAETLLLPLGQAIKQLGLPQRITLDRDPHSVRAPSGSDFPSALLRFGRTLGIEMHVCSSTSRVKMASWNDIIAPINRNTWRWLGHTPLSKLV